jgi:hypothetical protein
MPHYSSLCLFLCFLYIFIVLFFSYIILLHVGIRKRRFYGNAGDRCLGSDNSSVVILTEVSTVITKGQLSSNGHRYIRRGLHSMDSLGMTAVEDSRSLAATKDS